MKENIAINSVYIVMHETHVLFKGLEHGFIWNVFADKRQAEEEAIYCNEHYTKDNDFFFVIEKILY